MISTSTTSTSWIRPFVNLVFFFLVTYTLVANGDHRFVVNSPINGHTVQHLSFLCHFSFNHPATLCFSLTSLEKNAKNDTTGYTRTQIIKLLPHTIFQCNARIMVMPALFYTSTILCLALFFFCFIFLSLALSLFL